MLPPGAIFKLKMHQNVYAAGALPQTPLGQLTELPQTSNLVFVDRLRGRGWKGKGGEGREREGG